MYLTFNSDFSGPKIWSPVSPEQRTVDYSIESGGTRRVKIAFITENTEEQHRPIPD